MPQLTYKTHLKPVWNPKLLANGSVAKSEVTQAKLQEQISGYLLEGLQGDCSALSITMANLSFHLPSCRIEHVFIFTS